MGRQLFVRESEVGKSTDTESHYRYVPATPEDIIANRKQLHNDAAAFQALVSFILRGNYIAVEYDLITSRFNVFDIDGCELGNSTVSLKAALAAAGLMEEEVNRA